MQVYHAGISALGDHGGKRDSGLIQIVESPDSDKNIGVAMNTGKIENERALYTVFIHDGSSLGGDWVLVDGTFTPA
jgi:hypothetical protein